MVTKRVSDEVGVIEKQEGNLFCSSKSGVPETTKEKDLTRRGYRSTGNSFLTGRKELYVLSHVCREGVSPEGVWG